MNEVAERLKEAIQKSGLSYREIERKSGVPFSTVKKYADGYIGKCPLPRLEALAKALNVKATWMMGWEEEKPTPERDERARVFLDLFSKLPEDKKTFIIQAMRGLSEVQ